MSSGPALRAAVPDLELGRYVIRSSCGTTVGDPNVDITAPQVDRAGGALATAGVTTASMLVFFVLIVVLSLVMLVWRQRLAAATR